jgi:hypothetical protein
MLPDRVGRQLLLKQMKLVLPDVFRPEPVWGAPKILGEIADDVKVDSYGRM